MSRVKRGVMTRKRHNRVLKQTKGFWGQRKNVFTRAKETLVRAMAFAFKSRKLRKRDMRSLFIMRINAAVRQHGMSYSKFIAGMNKANIQINRKMLSQLAIFEPGVFAAVAQIAKG